MVLWHQFQIYKIMYLWFWTDNFPWWLHNVFICNKNIPKLIDGTDNTASTMRYCSLEWCTGRRVRKEFSMITLPFICELQYHETLLLNQQREKLIMYTTLELIIWSPQHGWYMLFHWHRTDSYQTEYSGKDKWHAYESYHRIGKQKHKWTYDAWFPEEERQRNMWLVCHYAAWNMFECHIRHRILKFRAYIKHNSCRENTLLNVANNIQ